MTTALKEFWQLPYFLAFEIPRGYDHYVNKLDDL